MEFKRRKSHLRMKSEQTPSSENIVEGVTCFCGVWGFCWPILAKFKTSSLSRSPLLRRLTISMPAEPNC